MAPFAYTPHKQKAFDIAKSAVAAFHCKDNQYKGEYKKFLLLPDGEAAAHDIVLFPRDGTNSVLSPGIPQTTNGVSAPEFFKDYTERRKRDFPNPPEAWEGRWTHVHRLITCIREDGRFVALHGQKGIGKTALLSKTFEYLWERKLFDGLFAIDPYTSLKSRPHESLAKLVAETILG